MDKQNRRLEKLENKKGNAPELAVVFIDEKDNIVYQDRQITKKEYAKLQEDFQVIAFIQPERNKAKLRHDSDDEPELCKG
jgi:hypothetical protein